MNNMHNMKKKYISNSSESSRMFKNDFLEAMSKVNFYIPLLIYIPVISWFSFIAFARGLEPGNYILYLLFGIFIWSVTEYLLHRFIFHFEPTSKSGKRLHFIFHGGFIMGYLIYDMMHYAIHHHNFKNPVLKKIKQHHMLHHYADPTKGYGVSSALWDIIFQSGFRAKN